MKIGIVGHGYVGKATALFGCEGVNVVIYDKMPNKCSPFNTRLSDMKDCQLVFVCVPTPMSEDGKSCNTSIVEEAITSVREHVSNDRIVLRSTVPVGTAEKLGVMYMPEFLTEANWKEDVKNCEDWVVGLLDVRSFLHQKIFHSLFHLAYKAKRIATTTPIFMTTEEAELVKNGRNAFLAVKVSFFNELEEFCRKKNISYEMVKAGIAIDSRIGTSHTAVPGPDGKRGYGGTCFPKDIASLYHQMSEEGMESYILEASVARNNQVDRTDQDWKSKKGRAVT
jgi:nucleotide sugar dehydrogenase